MQSLALALLLLDSCPLAPARPIDVGYHAVVGRNRQVLHEVPYTNLAYFSSYADIFTEVPPEDRPALVTQAMAEIEASGKRAVVNLSINRNSGLLEEDQIMAAIDAAGAGDAVAYLLLADEIDWPAWYVSERADRARDLWRQQFPELPVPPVGVTVTPPVGAESDMVVSSNLDFINIQGYMESCRCTGPCCCGFDAQKAVAEVLDALDAQEAHVPMSKFLAVTMQAYTRNGNFCQVEPNLVDVQTATYLWALGQERVRALVMFAWDRGSPADPIGSRFQPALAGEHRRLLCWPPGPR